MTPDLNNLLPAPTNPVISHRTDPPEGPPGAAAPEGLQLPPGPSEGLPAVWKGENAPLLAD